MKAEASVIICPGGAYCHLSPRESEPVARAFEEIGLEAEILQYPIRATEDDEPLGQGPVQLLSRRVEERRNASGGRPVFVCGFSAGGHLAATLGVHWRRLGLARPDALILCYPVITAETAYCNAQSFRNLCGAADREFYSLEKQVTADTPPVFLWHTAADRDVPVENSLGFAAALSGAGVPFELHVYPYGEHGLSLATEEVAQPERGRLPDAHVAGWFRACADWVRLVLDRR